MNDGGGMEDRPKTKTVRGEMDEMKTVTRKKHENEDGGKKYEMDADDV